MLAMQTLQDNLDGMKEISKNDYYLADTRGFVLAATGEKEFRAEDLRAFLSSRADSQEVGDYHYFKIRNEDFQPEYVLVTGGGVQPFMMGQMAVFQLQNLFRMAKERFDKESFFKNLLLDNLLLVDVYNRAKKLHIDVECRRIVFIVETEDGSRFGSLESLRTVLQEKKGDFVTAVDEKSVIIVRELDGKEKYAQMHQTGEQILEHVKKENTCDIRVGYGTIIGELQELSRSYKEAQMALAVGKIFTPESSVIAYSSLGIGRLIYQQPLPLCRMFIEEIFGENSPEDFDEEMLLTINKFFENNLNVSETSRQLYIHRNTLVYRLDKLQKLTGLDLRVFEDAITFRIALMVIKYMKYMEKNQY